MINTWRRARSSTCRPAQREVTSIPIIVELLSAALSTGSSIPDALEAIGSSIGGARGEDLRRVSAALILGASWHEAWNGVAEELTVIKQPLLYSWEFGAPAAQSLRVARETAQKESLAQARTRAQKLSVYLVVPLGICFLPAFILLAVVPIVANLAGALR